MSHFSRCFQDSYLLALDCFVMMCLGLDLNLFYFELIETVEYVDQCFPQILDIFFHYFFSINLTLFSLSFCGFHYVYPGMLDSILWICEALFIFFFFTVFSLVPLDNKLDYLLIIFSYLLPAQICCSAPIENFLFVSSTPKYLFGFVL